MQKKAKEFFALTRDSGFPYCLEKIDVSEYDYWITLSGHKKGDGLVSEQSIRDSHKLAMELFWNLYSVEAEGYSDLSFSVTGGGSFSTEALFDKKVPTEAEPRDRICSTSIGASDSEIDEERSCYEFDPDPPYEECTNYIDYGSAVGVSYEIHVVRMYDGETSEETNFVGYGVYNEGNSAIKITAMSGFSLDSPDPNSPDEETYSFTQEALSSFLNESDGDDFPDYYGEPEINYEYYLLDGFNFVKRTAEGLYDSSNNSDSITISSSSEASIKALEFYIYNDQV